jgi:uncharacterized membrane protein YqjE
VAHSAASSRPTAHEDASVGALVQSAMADMSTLIRSEIELAKAEVGRSAKKAGISVGLFGAAGVLLAFAGIYFFFTIGEVLDLWMPRWVAFAIVTAFVALLAGVAALIGYRMIKKLEKPERTMESLRELPEVLHREEPGRRRRDLPVVAHGQVSKRDPDTYLV